MAEKEDIVVKRFRRDNIAGKIKALYQLSLNVVMADADTAEFEVRFNKLESHYESFGRVQASILNNLVASNSDANLNEEKRLVEQIDTQYFAILAAHRRLVANHQDLVPRTDPVQNAPSVKLPKINLPFFDGQIKEWPHFKDLFTSLVHDNNCLQPIEKFQYLLSCLKGEPHGLARTLPVTTQNYATTWDQLVTRYDDKRRLATYYIDEIMTLQPLSAESPKKLRHLLDVCSENSTALSNLTLPVNLSDFLLFHVIVQKLDKKSRQLFESKFSHIEIPSLEQLLNFLKEHCKAVDAAQISEKVFTPQSGPGRTASSLGTAKPNTGVGLPVPNRFSTFKSSSQSTHAAFVADGNKSQCLYCNEAHRVYSCQKFLDLPVNQRREFIQSKQACFNCLSYGHMLSTCFSTSSCKNCSKRHHTLLHENFSPGSKSAEPSTKKVATSSPKSSASMSAHVYAGVGSANSTVLLGTAAVQIQDSHGKFHTIRALIDPGSQATFLTDSCVQKYSLQKRKFTEPVVGLSQTSVSTSKGLVDFVIKPRFQNGPFVCGTAIVLPNITADLPSSPLGHHVKKHFENYDLADPLFYVPGKIQMLLGADLYSEILDGGRHSSPPGMPTPYHSIFGWVLIGPTQLAAPGSNRLHTHLAITESVSLETCLKQFWQVEEPPSKVSTLSPEDVKCETFFIDSHERTKSGRYVVKLPFKDELQPLGDSYYHAEKSLNRLESRLSKNSTLRKEYKSFMFEYEELGHMRKLETSDLPPLYYIPHHPVYKSTPTGPKIRVVFNASAKTTSGESLNDQLLVGPSLQSDVCKILFNFRLEPIAFTADICKMYRQVGVHPNHQRYQAILWRPSPQDKVQVYYLTTVTYGVSSAPFLAIRTLHQLTQDEGSRYPEAAQVLLTSSFVDDLLVSCKSLTSAHQLKHDLISLLHLGGFQLKKWATNMAELIDDVPNSDKEIIFHKSADFQETQALKVLGVKWKPITDCFSYDVSVHCQNPCKRSILSLIARIYDPLGWVSPCVFWAKKLMQQLWLLGVDWDETPHESVINQWTTFVQNLPLLENVSIPRFALGHEVGLHSLQLHGFSDSSEAGYAACVYIRSISANGLVIANLVIAKSKVAPVKPLSIPKLELCGAVLVARLLNFCKDALLAKLGLTNITTFAWTDSQVVLNWIHTPPYKLKTFVANRIVEIQELVDPVCWRYTTTTTNPADCASRGLLPQQLIVHSLWWHGPSWLLETEDSWPAQPNCSLPPEKLPEVKSSILAAVVIDEPAFMNFIETFSGFTHLKRSMAYILRFASNCRLPEPQRSKGPLTTAELSQALTQLIKLTQKIYFENDIILVKQNEPCSPALQKLAPFIDTSGILRVGGRLKNSSLPFVVKHPVLLPKQGHLSRLIVKYYHVLSLHSGPRTMQSLIQQAYWIISARNVIRKEIRKCVVCTRFKAANYQPFMADLPVARTQLIRAFLQVGIDCGGPFITKSEKSRKPQLRKSYLCLFICLATKALHLELVSELSTDSFLAALHRFIARRGLCSDIFCDRGTNFVGAKNQLEELSTFIAQAPNSSVIQDKLSPLGITWHLNPAQAPHFGGIWEAGIKSAKHHIHHVVGNQILTFEELSTLFCQVEAVLNSRPICANSSSTDPSEIDVLTPGHFIIGAPLLSLPQPDLTHLPINRLSRWQLVNQMLQHFWKRWHVEYLHSLQQRAKWTVKKNPEPNVNDIVLIKEPNQPPQTWKIGKIIRTHPGKDGIVRVATIKTSQGTVTRPAVKLCPLPV